MAASVPRSTRSVSTPTPLRRTARRCGGATHKGLLEGVAAVQRDLSGKSIPTDESCFGASSSASSPPSNSPPNLTLQHQATARTVHLKSKRSELDESSGDQISESTESEEAVATRVVTRTSTFVAEISDIGTTVRKRAAL